MFFYIQLPESKPNRTVIDESSPEVHKDTIPADRKEVNLLIIKCITQYHINLYKQN